MTVSDGDHSMLSESDSQYMNELDVESNISQGESYADSSAMSRNFFYTQFFVTRAQFSRP